MTLVDFLRLLRRNLKLLGVCALAGLVVGTAYVFARPADYVASTSGIVVSGGSASGTANDQMAQDRATTYLTLVPTKAVADRTAEALAADGMESAASGSVSAERVPDTSLITITATGRTAEEAQALANTSMDSLIAEALRMETYGLTQGREVTQAEATGLATAHILPYEPAALPGAPDRPDLVLSLLAGLAAGLAVGTVLAIIRAQFDVKVRTRADVEELTGHVVLGVIPETKDVKGHRDGSGDVTKMGHAGEAMRQLRTNLRFANVDNPPRSVVVTSANPAEGKSSVSAMLAQVIARTGQNVVLVDCDLRKPVQAGQFGVDSQIGLTQVLVGDVPVRDALVPSPVAGLQLLPAGKIPPNPSELVGSRRMRQVIDDLTQDSFVVIDAPPVLPVTDAGLLAVEADGVILVSVVGKTLKVHLGAAARQMEMVGATVFGCVLNKAPRGSAGDVLYGSGYGTYGGDYGDTPAETSGEWAQRPESPETPRPQVQQVPPSRPVQQPSRPTQVAASTPLQPAARPLQSPSRPVQQPSPASRSVQQPSPPVREAANAPRQPQAAPPTDFGYAARVADPNSRFAPPGRTASVDPVPADPPNHAPNGQPRPRRAAAPLPPTPTGGRPTGPQRGVAG